MTRETRSPRDRATDALRVELGKLTRTRGRIAKLEPELQAAREVAESLEKRVAYLGGDPVLDEGEVDKMLEPLGVMILDGELVPLEVPEEGSAEGEAEGDPFPSSDATVGPSDEPALLP